MCVCLLVCGGQKGTNICFFYENIFPDIFEAYNSDPSHLGQRGYDGGVKGTSNVHRLSIGWSRDWMTGRQRCPSTKTVRIWISQSPQIPQISKHLSQNIQHLVFIPIPKIVLSFLASLWPKDILILIPGVLVLWYYSEENICESQNWMSLHCRGNRRFSNATNKHREAWSAISVVIFCIWRQRVWIHRPEHSALLPSLLILLLPPIKQCSYRLCWLSWSSTSIEKRSWREDR